MLLAIVTAGLCAQSLDSSDNQPPSTQATSTVRSTRAQWSSTVNAFATALLDSSDSTMHSLLADDVIVRQFNRAGRQQLSQLRDHVSGMRVIMCSAYPQTPNSLAGDIANAIKDVPLPEDVKRRLTPPDEANLKRANATASKWISASLFTSGSEPVAVVVLWKEGMEPATTQPGVAAGDDDDNKGESRPALAAMPMFVLVKGDIVGDRVQISQICFGDPLTFNPGAGDDHGGSTAAGN